MVCRMLREYVNICNYNADFEKQQGQQGICPELGDKI